MNNSKTSREQLGVIINPMKLLKTVGSSFPIASSAVEIFNQLEGNETKKRIESLESRVELAARISAYEGGAKIAPMSLTDWSVPASEYLIRTVDIGISYDSGFHDFMDPGIELVQNVAHACIIGPSEILVCNEAKNLVETVAGHKQGTIWVLAGFARYRINPNPSEVGVGLSVFHLTERDEEKWSLTKEKFGELSFVDPIERFSRNPIKYDSSTYIGQEFGFIHSGEATDVMSGLETFSRRQFDTATISHFRKPTDETLKVAVTGVLPGRICQAGSPAFSREGHLIGIVSDTENYESDAGRRAVIKSLLGLSRFRNPNKQN